MNITLIAAVSENGIIGKDGTMPWGKIPEDLRHFKELTMGFPVIMGRKTYQSIKPLKGRRNIVLTRNNLQGQGVLVVHSMEEALKEAEMYNELIATFQQFSLIPRSHDNLVYIIGGGEIYSQTISLAGKLEVTRVHKNVEGDTYFPEINPNVWKETKREDKGEYSFVTYARR
ncbi:MAG: dihydrofolate reductase [Candidatus Nanoarchaeia archaeon]|nr:dihydrofolate reductase [Candidatus Nanoarchaeia archaeon]